MTRKRTKRRAVDTSALASDLGSEAIPREFDDVAIGSRHIVKRARRADPLDRIDLTDGQRSAALLWRQAFQHHANGLPWKLPDAVRERRADDSLRMALWPQERALSASTAYRRGQEVMGEAAYNGAPQFVVIQEWSLAQYDAYREWREGTGKRELKIALDKLARAFGTHVIGAANNRLIRAAIYV